MVRIWICLSEIFLLEFTPIASTFVRFVYTPKYQVSKLVNLQAPSARVFCAFSPTDKERNLDKQVEEMYVQVMTTILLR